MEEKYTQILIIFGVAAMVASSFGCASTQVASNHVIVAEQDMFVTNIKGESKNLTKGGKLELEGKEPVLVEAPGRVSLLVVPPTYEPQELRVRLKKISDWGGPQLESIMDNIFTGALEELYKVQVLLGSGKAQEALVKVRELRQKYPNVSYLQLVEISCLEASGQKAKADALSESLKKKRPDLFDRKVSGDNVPDSGQKRNEASQ